MPAKILVVDDTPGNVKLLAGLLAGNGYGVVTAASGAEALSQIDREHPDLVLLDVVMPGMSGYDVCAALRGDPSKSMLPIVLVTTLEAPEERVRGLEAGADDFITKPINEAELLARVRSLLRIKQLYDTVEHQKTELAAWNQNLERRVAEQVTELERLGSLQRFLPKQIAELIVSGEAGDPLASHRGDITVVFVDLRGFTAFAEAAEPEDVMAVLNQFHRAMGGLVLESEGTLERFTGDGLMAFFNDPVAVPDASERAVRTALAMRETFTGLSAEWRRRGYDLGIGIGISRGYATIGAIGFERRFDYGAIGNVTNLAARLCADAKPGQILICRRVLMDVDTLVDVEALGEQPLKGFQKPVATYQVRGFKQAGDAAPSPAEEPPSMASRVGRVFRREGEYWTIVYDGQSVRLRDSKGLRYIAQLLRKPELEVHALDLLNVANTGDAGGAIDAQAREAYRRRLEEMRAELEEAESFNDIERARRAREEIEFLSQELSAAVGLGGRDRKAASASERARVNVTRAIADGVRRISEHHPKLGRYLDSAIRTGTFCAYEPPDRESQLWEL